MSHILPRTIDHTAIFLYQAVFLYQLEWESQFFDQLPFSDLDLLGAR